MTRNLLKGTPPQGPPWPSLDVSRPRAARNAALACWEHLAAPASPRQATLKTRFPRLLQPGDSRLPGGRLRAARTAARLPQRRPARRAPCAAATGGARAAGAAVRRAASSRRGGRAARPHRQVLVYPHIKILTLTLALGLSHILSRRTRSLPSLAGVGGGAGGMQGVCRGCAGCGRGGVEGVSRGGDRGVELRRGVAGYGGVCPGCHATAYTTARPSTTKSTPPLARTARSEWGVNGV